MECIVVEGWKAWAFLSGGVMIGIFLFVIMSVAKSCDDEIDVHPTQVNREEGTP